MTVGASHTRHVGKEGPSGTPTPPPPPPPKEIRSVGFALLSTMSTLETLRFDNLALRTLPVDKETRNYVRTVSGAVFSRVSPAPLESPAMVVFSDDAMMLLDLPASELQRKDAAEYFSGNKLLPGSETAAHCYCGHQFGYFAGQLGDGAAMYLGEVINHKGERWEIQLKGAGLTPYSRSADGRKVLRSSLREFLCSEAMHYLGVPTTRAGTCVTSSTTVSRDMFYDGHPKNEKCSVILRIAPTFLRDLVTSFYDTLERTGADFTRSFRCLSTLAVPGHPDHEPSKESLLSQLLSCSSSHAELSDHLKAQAGSRDFQLFLILSRNNPELLEQLGKGALAKERIMAQIEKTKELKEMSAEDFEARKKKMWADWIEAYCKRLMADVEGVKDLQDLQQDRVDVMNSNNPRYSFKCGSIKLVAGRVGS
ncbi:hypothetical protein HPB51_025143 [Rhipicephalus microplus]|uniref:Selenoprotein O n=1 Tax=Rhipicephalus microplus TaxID=6941 RepID=A0A9J6DR30_RHIMP|nr:hypothetical protein HPB51_025143 [Rhipicephalus microplus]